MKTKLWQSMILIWNKARLTWAADIVYIMILFIFYIGILILWNDEINLSGWYCGREWESIGCKLIGLLKRSKGGQYSTVYQLIKPFIISPIHLWIHPVYQLILCTNYVPSGNINYLPSVYQQSISPCQLKNSIIIRKIKSLPHFGLPPEKTWGKGDWSERNLVQNGLKYMSPTDYKTICNHLLTLTHLWVSCPSNLLL